jgi:hypothetical protein
MTIHLITCDGPLESYRFTEIFIADGNAATDFAKEPCVFDKVLVLFWITYLKAEIVQVTKVFVVSAVRHICVGHNKCLLNKRDFINSYSFA